MAGRYELPEGTWPQIADLFERKKATGRPRRDDRLMLNSILWAPCSGACWRDLLVISHLHSRDLKTINNFDMDSWSEIYSERLEAAMKIAIMR